MAELLGTFHLFCVVEFHAHNNNLPFKVQSLTGSPDSVLSVEYVEGIAGFSTVFVKGGPVPCTSHTVPGSNKHGVVPGSLVEVRNFTLAIGQCDFLQFL